MHDELTVLLRSLEAELHPGAMGRCTAVTGGAARLLQPFACDTLSLDQWLQMDTAAGTGRAAGRTPPVANDLRDPTDGWGDLPSAG